MVAVCWGGAAWAAPANVAPWPQRCSLASPGTLVRGLLRGSPLAGSKGIFGNWQERAQGSCGHPSADGSGIDEGLFPSVQGSWLRNWCSAHCGTAASPEVSQLFCFPFNLKSKKEKFQWKQSLLQTLKTYLVWFAIQNCHL